VLIFPSTFVTNITHFFPSHSQVVYSALYEVLVDFTKDYSQIKAALSKIEHFDKTCLHNVLLACSNILTSNWGSQSYAQIVMVTDLGIGLGPKSIKNLINGLSGENQPLPFPLPSKFSIMCLGNADDDPGFKHGMHLYQQLLDISKQKGQLFTTRPTDSQSSMERSVVKMFKAMCEANYKPFEAVLNIGSYPKLEAAPISIFPEPLAHVSKDVFGNETTRTISKRLEVCGYIKIADLVGSGGSPASISRNLIFPRVESTQKKNGSELEKLESEMKNFFAKNAAADDDESSSSMTNTDVTTKESAIVLLHGALKVENMAALVLLADDWYGLAYSYSDKKKSNLMLSILPPGNNIIPWIGDFRFLGLARDALPGESYGFPVKTEKKSYSSGNMSWLREGALQSDIQKVLK
jgi:Integrator complex subunit 14/von Willebrand factor type A domain